MSTEPESPASYYSLLYASTLVIDLHGEGRHQKISNFLARINRRNLLAGLTGLLVFSDARLLHALEGERAAVQAFFQRVLQDQRHVDAHLLAAQFSTTRRFDQCGVHYVGQNPGLKSCLAAHGVTPPARGKMLDFMVELALENAALTGA
jgi:hypothetical protein